MCDGTSGTTEEAHNPRAPELTLAHLDALPTLAPIAIRLLQITADDSSDAQDVINVLRGDQSLTAKILSVANSSAVGARGKVSTLERAVGLLGFRAIRSIVLAVKVFECFARQEHTREPRHFEPVEFWKHSLGVACAARRLAATRPQLKLDPEEAFVAGLLHDLGKVALDAVFPKAYERVAAQAKRARCDIADCERAVLGVDHTVAGRHLARRWGFPRFLQDVIWLHHVAAETLTSSVASPVLIALIRLANTLIREQRIGHSGNYAFYEPSARLAEYLGLAGAEVEAILRDVVGDVAEHAALLGLDQETPETLYFKSLTRANAELGRLNTELLAANRRLTAAGRYFKAVAQFDRQLSASSELTAVVAAIAEAALTALQRSRLAAFGVHDQRAAIELGWAGSEEHERGNTTQRLTNEMREWLQEPGEGIAATVVRAPLAVRSMTASVTIQLGKGECWLLPIVHDEQIAGGIVFFSERDERAELAPETQELRSSLASFGLALGRANVQAAARRLSEDLAESNRRLQQMQAQVLRTRALSMIAEMAAGAGHELNSPLTVISGRAQMLTDAVQDPEVKRTLGLIRDKAHECSRIVTELMDFARPPPPQPSDVDVGALLAEVRDAWQKRSGLPASRFQVDLPDESQGTDLPRVFVDRAQIRSVLDEVVQNAVDAVTDNGGTIMIRWRAGMPDPLGTARSEREAQARVTGRPAEHVPKGWVEITIQDTGSGMSPEVVQRVFDPFFSQRRAGRRRGLGLARAYRIVEAHGGRIRVESRPGEGTTFHITLPQATSE